MRKKIWCVYMIVILIVIVGCKDEISYKFLHTTSEIDTIQIVKVGEVNERGENDQEIITTIENKDLFIEEFEQLGCYNLYTDPAGIEINTIAIKIIYNNLEYELIAASGQARYTVDEQFKNYIGYCYFDKLQFENFLSKYM